MRRGHQRAVGSTPHTHTGRVGEAAVKAVVEPRSVITLAEDGTLGLRVIGADDVAAFAPVTIIDDTEAGMVVTGVPEGVRIVVAGQDLVRNGDKVTVVTQ